MKKLSRLQLVLLVVAIAMLAGSAYCIVVIVQKTNAASDLDTQIAKTEQEMLKISSQYNIVALEAEVAALQQEIANAPFPQMVEVENNEVHDLVLDAEHDSGVKVLSFVPGEATTANIASTGMNFMAKSYAIGATATDLSRLYDFLGQIESNALVIPYKTLVIDGVEFVHVSSDEGQPSSWEINITVVVYTQQ